jgi:hypothetical protein
MKKRIQLLATVTLTVFGIALSPKSQAVVPPPDGGYPGGNTAEGRDALLNLTTGTYNTAIGLFSLRANNVGNFNTGIGAGTLRSNTADENTATGAEALLNNTTGFGNTANGAFALSKLRTGTHNNAVGVNALSSQTTGNSNNAVGAFALAADTEGQFNCAFGESALVSNTIGIANTAMGDSTLLANTTGNNNTAIGVNALGNNTVGSSNVAVGSNAGLDVFTANNVTCIGNLATGADVSDTTWIGNIYGVTTQSGTTAPVVVSDGGQLGTVASSERFKKDIVSMDKNSEAIMSLRPVTFHYKTDTKGTPQFGLIAEEVAKVNPALVLPDKEGKPYTVRYEAVNAMLLNEFLKEHHQVQDLKAIVVQQQKQIGSLTAGLQKVSAQLELSKPAPQTVLNNQ